MCDQTPSPLERPKLLDSVSFLERDGVHVFFDRESKSWFCGPSEARDVLLSCNGSNDVTAIITAMREKGVDGDVEGLVQTFLASVAEMGFLEGTTVPREEPSHFPCTALWLLLTQRCNLRCSYCYLAAGKALENELSTDEVMAVIDDFEALGGGESQLIALSGGEALLRDDIFEIAGYIKDKGMSTILATNGFLVDDDTAKLIKENITYTHLSLDGPREVHDAQRGKGSYDKVITALENLTEAGAPCYIEAVVTRGNLKDVPHVLEVAHRFGIREVKTPPLLPLGRGDREQAPSWKELEALYAELRRKREELEADIVLRSDRDPQNWPQTFFDQYPCGAGVTSVCVDADGTVTPCQAVARMPEFQCGNVRHRSLRELWNDPATFRTWRSARTDDIEGCKDCDWKRYCCGGCRLRALGAYGTIFHADPFCDWYARTLEEFLWNQVRTQMENQTAQHREPGE